MMIRGFFALLLMIPILGTHLAHAAPGSVASLERAILEYIAEVARPLIGPDQISAAVRIEVEEGPKKTASTKTGKVIEIRLGSLDVTTDYVVPAKRAVASTAPLPPKKVFMDKVKSIHVVLTIAPEVNPEAVKVLKRAVQKGWPFEKHPVNLEVLHHHFMEAPDEPGAPSAQSVVVKPINKIQVSSPTAAPQGDFGPWVLLGIGILIAASILFSGFQIGKIRLKAEVILPASVSAGSETAATAAVHPEFHPGPPSESFQNESSVNTVVQDVSRLETEQFDVIDLETTKVVPEAKVAAAMGANGWSEMPHEILKIAFQDLDADEKKILIWTRPAAEWSLWIERLTDPDSRIREQLKVEMELLRENPLKTTEWISKKSRIEGRFVESCLKVAHHRPDLQWGGLGKNAKVS